MILQSLCRYYNLLADTHPDEISKPGWCPRRVAFMLDLSPEGELRGVIPSPDDKGWQRIVPEQVKRSSGVAANCLCDNAAYILGFDDKGKPERSLKCFEAAKALHLEVLKDVRSEAAHAVRSFFERWNPSADIEDLLSQLASVDVAAKMLSGGMLEFSLCGKRVIDDLAVRGAWERYRLSSNKGAFLGVCLVTGEHSPIARLHPAIKGVCGAQSMGASLVGFNAPAFESYGHDGEQGLNAPVSEQATFAYSTALNYLLSDRKHHMILGDTTVVYWAERNDEMCTLVVSSLLGGSASPKGAPNNPDEDINAIMKRIRSGRPVEGADFDEPFYVLGLAPNAARLSVRFFHRSTFGEVLENLAAHYERIEIAGRGMVGEKRYLTPYMLLKEVENPHASKGAVSPLLGGALLRSILDDTDYPEALFTNAILRTRATQDDKDSRVYKVTKGRAAIIRAYLIKNKKRSKEEVTVSLNEERTDVPYVIGRLFYTLESMQQTANPGINTTIKDRYFNSACATPGLVFPTLLGLAQSHLSKIRRDRPGLAIHLEQRMAGLLDELDSFPKRLSLEEQGDFYLGYYQQERAQFDGRKSAKTEDDSNEQEA